MQIINDVTFEYSEEDYDAVKDQFVQLCLQCGISLRNIGFFGDIGFPGVSDIDALVICSPKEIKKLHLLFRHEAEHSKDFGYLFWHVPVYVIDSLAYLAPKLHTFNNLIPLKDGIALFDKKNEINEEELKLLNIIWFVNLIKTFMDYLRKESKGEKVSLRHILLVYSNIMYSAVMFTGEKSNIPNDLPSVNQIRVLAKENKNDFSPFLWEKLKKLFEYTLCKFDEYCKKNLKVYPETISSTMLLSVTTILKKGEMSSIENVKFINTIVLNPLAYSFISDISKNKSNDETLNVYLNASLIFQKEYLFYKIQYPFIMPPGMPTATIKSYFVRAANKIQLAKFL
jgi:hypothetical protein